MTMPPRGQVGQVHLEGRRVHRDEHVRLVAGGVDVVAGEADLEGADAGQRALGRADLGWNVRDRADVVAEDSGRLGELRARELHAVAGVTGEADGYAVDILDVWVRLVLWSV